MEKSTFKHFCIISLHETYFKDRLIKFMAINLNNPVSRCNQYTPLKSNHGEYVANMAVIGLHLLSSFVI
jgi:hypothetical protein